MKITQLTKKEIKMFMLGVLTLFLIELAFDWDNAVQGFNDGLEGKPYKVSK